MITEISGNLRTCKDGFIGDGTDQCNDINEELEHLTKMIMLMVINVIF